MKSLASLLALGLLLAGSHVAAAPAEPSSVAAEPSSSTDVDEASAPIASIVAEFNSTGSLDVEDDKDPELSKGGATNLRKMTRKYKKYIIKTLRKRRRGDSCTLDKLSVRKEWGSMSRRQRIRYTDAVKCLHSINKPLSNPAEVPGARNRFDDFAASHIQEGQNIHFDGYLFVWHRHFVYAYEQALRKECGYRGPTPYWDWTLSADDPRRSPVFDGSSTSMSGNGESIPHGGTYVSAFGLNVTLPPGTGGGCVKDGPFKDFQVNLGLDPNVLPASPADLVSNLTTTGLMANGNRGAVQNALEYNPRCLTRDINLFWSQQTRTSDVENLLGCNDVDCLEKRADGWEIDRTQPQPLFHAAGHFAVGGLQNDPFASPGDPVFFLHHAAFDRVWSIWQAQDPNTRTYQVGGTRTPFNTPPSDKVTLDDQLKFGAVAQSVKFRDVVSSIDGPYCYMYD